MTLVDVITVFDKTRPNSFDFETKRRWVLSIETEIRRFACLHGNKAFNTELFKEENPNLFLDECSTDLYVSYLVSMGDLANAEYRLYNMSGTYFNNAFAQWKKFFRASNCPNQAVSIKV